MIWGGPQMISLMCNIVFSINSKQTNIQYKCVDRVSARFYLMTFKTFLIPNCHILPKKEANIVKIADLQAHNASHCEAL